MKGSNIRQDLTPALTQWSQYQHFHHALSVFAGDIWFVLGSIPNGADRKSVV